MSDTASPPEPAAPTSFARRHWGKLTLAAVFLVPALVFTIWAGAALAYTYSTGERAGYVQKLGKKGWLCKTWEGELQQTNVPGLAPTVFRFTVRTDSVAQAITGLMGKGQVSLQYDQHRGVPTSCFGETEYFVTGVRLVHPE